MSQARSPSAPSAKASERRSNGAVLSKPGKATPIPTITLSGNRSKDHFQIEVDGEVVELTHAALKTLVKLLIARAGAGSGFVRIPRLAIYRLRQTLDHALNPEIGEELIETGCGEEYRLTFEPNKLRDHVALQPSFFELEELRVFSKSQAQVLHGLCKIP